MKLWVGVTDKNCYEHLLRPAPEEVNFWQPSGSRSFRVLQPGEPFLFKLHSPENFIVGGGFFVRCSALPVLEAAHIKPYTLEGPHSVNNGILLRSDLHKLFDLGYITVTSALRLEVSSRLKAEWENGRDYYAYHGKQLQCRPADVSNLPSSEFLRWHNEDRFKG